MESLPNLLSLGIVHRIGWTLLHVIGAVPFFVVSLSLIGLLDATAAVSTSEVAEGKRILPPPTGQVLDAENQPVAGATVALYYGRDSYDPGAGFIETTASDPNGRFAFDTSLTFENLRRDGDSYAVVAWDATKAFDLVKLGGTSKGSEDLRLVLGQPRQRTVTVRDAGGDPIPGAEVYVRSVETKEDGHGLTRAFLRSGIGPLSVTTNREGHAVFSQLPDRGLTFRAGKQGYSPSWTGCGSDSKTEPVIVLNLAGVVAGTVYDPSGKPLAEALVTATPEFNLRDFNYARTDELGRYQLNDLYGEGGAWTRDGGTGRYRVYVDHDRFKAKSQSIQVGIGETIQGVDFRTRPGIPVTVKLLCPETLDPVEGAILYYHTEAKSGEVETDANGEVRITVPKGTLDLGLWQAPARSYVTEQIRPSTEGRPHTLTAQVGAPGEFTLYTPSPIGKLVEVSGRVVLPDGTPAANVKISALTKDRSHLVIEDRHGSGPRAVTTDDSGKFVFKNYPAGKSLEVFARHMKRPFAAIVTWDAIQGDTTLPDLVLTPTIETRLRIVDLEGQPHAKKAVRYGPYTRGEDPTRARSVPTVSRERQFRATSDAEGYITFRRVVPGYPYDFYLDGHDYSWKRLTADEIQSSNTTVVTLDDRMRLQLRGRDDLTTQVTRLVSSEDGFRKNPPDWSRIEILKTENDAWIVPKKAFVFHAAGAETELWAELDDGERIKFKGTFPSLENTLIVSEESGPEKHFTRVIAPFEIGPDNYALRVVDKTGSPIDGVEVLSRPIPSEELIHGRTDAKGWVTFQLTRPPVYLEFRKEGYAPQWLGFLESGQGQEVTLTDDTYVTSRFVMPDGSPAGEVEVFLGAKRMRNSPIQVHAVKSIPFQFTTDERGKARHQIQPGIYQLRATGPDGHFLIRDEFVVADGGTTELPAVLEPGPSVTLRFVDSLTGEPVEGLHVSISEQIDAFTFGPIEGSLRASNQEGWIEWDSVPPGVLRLSCASFHLNRYPTVGPISIGGTVLRDNTTAPYSRWWSEAHIWDQGTSAQWNLQPPTGTDALDDIVLDVSQDADVEVVVERGVHLQGRVALPEELPDVYLSAEVVPHTGQRTEFSGDSRSGFQINREDGTFDIRFPAGNGVPYHLAIYSVPRGGTPTGAVDLLPVAVSEPFESRPGDTFRFDLSMLGGGIVEGQVVDIKGEPVADIVVRATPVDYAGGIQAEPKVRTDADGRFRLGRLREGSYWICPGMDLYAWIPIEDLNPVEVLDGETTNAGAIRWSP